MSRQEMDEARVLASDEARYQALYAQDCEALGAMLDESYVHTHANGKVDSKAEFLASIRAARYRFVDAARSQQLVRRFGDVWVLNGLTQTRIVVGTLEKTMRNAFVTVWKQDGNDLKLVHWQATALPAP